MQEDVRKVYLKENLLTGNEVVERLQISKTNLYNLVKNGSLETAFESSQGLLFFKDKVRAYQIAKNRTSSLYYKAQPVAVLENNYFDSMEFEEALQRMDKIERVHIYFDEMDAALDGFYGPHPNTWLIGLEGAEAIRSPRLVIVDKLGQQMWSFCGTAGYNGTGPGESKRVLQWISKELNVPAIAEEDINKLFEHRVIRYVLDNDHWIVYAEDSASSPAGHWNNQGPQAQLVLYQGRLIMLQINDEFSYNDESLIMINRYKHFIPSPIGYRLYSPKEAPHFSENGHPDSADYKTVRRYPLIIEDASGRELWLSPNLENTRQTNSSLKELLESAGVQVEASGVLNKFSDWLSKHLSKR